MEMNTKVKITDLGRGKFCGEFTYRGTGEEVIEQIKDEIGKHLLSSDVSLGRPLMSTGKNPVYAGFQKVGEIQVWRTTHE